MPPSLPTVSALAMLNISPGVSGGTPVSDGPDAVTAYFLCLALSLTLLLIYRLLR